MYELKVGAGIACINPPMELLPFPGYENYQFEGILSDLRVRAVLLDNGSKRYLFLAVDAGSTPENELKEEICKKYGLEKECLCAVSTHNHSSPFWGVTVLPGNDSALKLDKQLKYRGVVIRGIYDAIDQAVASLRPAKYGFGEGKSYISTNRDSLFEDGYWMQGQNYAGFSDKTLAVMKFEDMDGKLIAAIVNYACHATTAFCTLDTDGKGKMSSGFPGIACDFVEERYGDGAVVLWCSGAAGNQNPLFSSEGFPRIYEQDGYSESFPTPPGTQFMIQRNHGQVHALDIIRTLRSIPCVHPRMRIVTGSNIVELQGQRAPEGVDMQMNRLFVDNFVRKYHPELFEHGNKPEKKLVDMIPCGVVPLHLQLAILGDVAWVGMGAEPYNQIGVKCKEASPFRNTVVVTHTESFETAAGYILDDSSAHHKVFQSYSKVRPGNNDQPIVDGMLEMFDQTING